MSLDEALRAVGRLLADQVAVELLPIYDGLERPLHRTAAGLQLFLCQGGVDAVWGGFITNIDNLESEAVPVSAARTARGIVQQ